MKAYAIFDLPDGIKKAEIAYDLYDSQTGVRLEAKACDLKPLPKKRDTRIFYFEAEETDYRSVGFNECLAEITGETE